MGSIIQRYGVSKESLFLTINISLLLTISIIFRLVNLANIPGINGDEAWFSVQVFELSSGRAFPWRTPTGNLMDPFFSGIIYFLQMFFSPSFWILRLPAAISGILAIILTFYLMADVLGKRTAIIATILAATFPINIAYSRFGWNQSQTTLASIISIYFAFKRNWFGLILSLIAALIVHPTNIFLVPFLVSILIIPLLPKSSKIFQTQWQRLSPKRRQIYLILCITVFIIILSFGLTLPKLRHILGILTIEHISGFFNKFQITIPRLQHIPGSLTNGRSLGFFNKFSLFFYYYYYYGQLLSGVTIYRYIVGPNSSPIWMLHDVIFWSLFILVIFSGTRRLIKARQWNLLAVVIGLFPTLVWFSFIVPVGAIMPDNERYAMFLMMPSTVVIAILTNSISQTRRERWLSIIVTMVIGWLFLWSFYSNYFGAIKTTGGLSHRTFRTAAIEPKQQAFSFIMQNHTAGEPITILAEDWWLYWPIRYLAETENRIQVYNLEDQKYSSQDLESAILKGTYIVGFSEGELVSKLNQLISKHSVNEWNVKDYQGGRLLSIWYKADITAK